MTVQPRTSILVSKTCCRPDYSVRSRERTIIQDIRKKKPEPSCCLSVLRFSGAEMEISIQVPPVPDHPHFSLIRQERTYTIVRTTAPQLVSAPLPPVIFGEVMEMSEWGPLHNPPTTLKSTVRKGSRTNQNGSRQHEEDDALPSALPRVSLGWKPCTSPPVAHF
jgi:hypothetical protein